MKMSDLTEFSTLRDLVRALSRVVRHRQDDIEFSLTICGKRSDIELRLLRVDGIQVRSSQARRAS